MHRDISFGRFFECYIGGGLALGTIISLIIFGIWTFASWMAVLGGINVAESQTNTFNQYAILYDTLTGRGELASELPDSARESLQSDEHKEALWYALEKVLHSDEFDQTILPADVTLSAMLSENRQVPNYSEGRFTWSDHWNPVRKYGIPGAAYLILLFSWIASASVCAKRRDSMTDIPTNKWWLWLYIVITLCLIFPIPFYLISIARFKQALIEKWEEEVAEAEQNRAREARHAREIAEEEERRVRREAENGQLRPRLGEEQILDSNNDDPESDGLVENSNHSRTTQSEHPVIAYVRQEVRNGVDVPQGKEIAQAEWVTLSMFGRETAWQDALGVAKSSVSTLEGRLQSFAGRIKDTQRELGRERAQLALIENSKPDEAQPECIASLQQDFDRLLAHPSIAMVRIESDRITVHTYLLMEEWSRRKFCHGAWQIVLRHRHGQLQPSITCLISGRRNGSSEPIYLAGGEDWGFCFGTLRSTIEDFLRRGELYAALSMMIKSIGVMNEHHKWKLTEYLLEVPDAIAA